MNRFQFRLQSVLDYREQVEHQRELMFARAIQIVQAQQRKLMDLGEVTAEAIECMREHGRQRVDVAALRQEGLYLASVRKRIAQAVGHLRRIENELDLARVRFIGARKDRRALELLRETRMADYRREADREGQRELDEIGTHFWRGERSAG